MKELLNRIAPDFSLPALGGGHLTLSELRGKVVVLNFWSAECPWSRRADVVMVYRQLSWEPKGVRIVGIVSNHNEPETEVQYEAESRHVKYPLVFDEDQKVAEQYKAETTPHFFIVDRLGFIRYNGALDDATYKQRRPKVIYLDQAVTAVLAGKVPNPAVTPPYGCVIVRSMAVEGGSSIQPVG